MNSISAPSSLLTEEQIEQIRNSAFLSEKAGQLTTEQLALINNNNWFNLFVPRSLGGLEMSLPEATRLQESLAKADGSFGWTVTLCSGANWFAGFLSPELRDEVFAVPSRICLSGSGAITGKAALTNNGYLISGFWKYATGSPHATHFTANCRIEKDGIPVTDEAGNTTIAAFLFKREEVKIINEWNCIGMKATASHSFSVENLPVAANRAFSISPLTARLPQPVFYFPFIQFAELTIAANFSGITSHFIDLCHALFHSRVKQKGYTIEQACDVFECLGRSKTKFEADRILLFETMDAVWAKGLETKQWRSEDLNSVTVACQSLVKTARNTVNTLFPFCGIVAVDASSEINRVWRDFSTASQHSLFTVECL
ncbi:MAG: acyl-CoA dehydrogenase [Chitinophagaceae bacterium]|nr:acyl-CoA dehydrogenase [Chitinophagaceae bacterium]